LIRAGLFVTISFMRCPEYIPNISDGAKFEPHPVDPLRPDFNHHVVGPLSHVVAVRTLDDIGNDFLSSLRKERGKRIRKQTRHFLPTQYATSLLNALSSELDTMARAHLSGQKDPTSGVLSSRQEEAMKRFGSPLLSYKKTDIVLYDEIDTIRGMINVIARRHPELGLEDTQTLIAFLRDPETPGIFRGFGTGGSGFIDAFRFNNHPATEPWRRDIQKPVLDTSGPVLRTTKEVREAAQQSREISQRVLDHPLSVDEILEVTDYGLFGSGKAFSDGCPARHLKFRTDVASLVINDLSLSAQQVEQLISMTTAPVIKQTGPASYDIVRDSYVEASRFFANALEVITR
jgi:hypothetical protein